MSKRPDITAKLSQLVEKRLDSQNIFWSPEVNFDGGKKRVDFVGFHSKLGAPEAVAVELGQFEFYEVKSSMADFTSGHGLTFYGDKNFLVCLPELAQQLVEQQAIPERVDMILCPDKNWKRLVPKIDRMRVGLHRERTAAEMLWAIVKTHREGSEMHQVGRNLFQSSGGELMVQAAEDWKDQCSDDEPFSEFFEECKWINPHKQYRYDSELGDIEEVFDE